MELSSIKFFENSVSNLAEPRYAVLFLLAAIFLYYIARFLLGRRNISRKIHHAVGILISLLLALILVGISAAIGLL